MFKTRVALLGALALFIASGIATSSASAAGPFWHVNGSKFETGTRQIKLQLKGVAKLTAETKPEAFVITCNSAASEGSTIEGNGNNQGQGKGRITFSSCKTSIKTCTPVEPITTNPIKSYLAEAATQSGFAEAFEPGQGSVFTNITLKGTCGVLPTGTPLAVKGDSVAEPVPGSTEAQEGLLNFPVVPITEIKHEGVVVKQAMEFGGITATFSGPFGARLQTGEKFGVFAT